MPKFLKPFEIDQDDLSRLSPVDFVHLLKRLIQSELHTAGIPQRAADGTLKINISDGGEDIRVEWEDGPEHTNYLPRRCNIIQCKAEKLNDSKVKNEPLTRKKSGLKPAVAEVVTRHGAYILAASKINTITPKRSKPEDQNNDRARIKELEGILRSSITEFARDDALETAIHAYGPSKLTDWVNAHPMIAIWVKQCLGTASADFSFQTMEAWSSYRDLSNELVTWDALSDHSKAIQAALAKPGEVIRLLGHSGLGKSRLAYEALLTTNANATTDLTPLVAYARHFSPQLVQQASDFIQNGQRVVLVVDECDPEGHRRLSDEVHRVGSLLSLISLDLEFEKPPSLDREIVIDAAPDDSIRKILLSLDFNGSPEDLERVVKFCSGYPRIAVLVSAAIKEGAEHFADFRDNDHFVNKLVWGRGTPKAELMRCLRCLALFEAVGIANPKREELEWVAENLLHLNASALEANLEHFFDRRILQKRGYSVAVLPRPLAAQLAALYWKNASEEQKKLVASGSMPTELIVALCNRLPDLEFVSHARDVAKQLCGKQGPFGSAKTLNTEFGARCLRKLAEVAPHEVIDTIVREFGEYELAKLQQDVGPGRRYLVWTLDALAWEPSVFSDTMRMLLKFAGAENETWSNNATAEFVQRFRVQLPGTSASFDDRIACLEALAVDITEKELPILISALGAAIDAQGHSRAVGSEKHGTRKTYTDFRPKLWKEIFDYVRACLGLLEGLSQRGEQFKILVRQAVASINLDYVIAPAVFDTYAELIRKLRPNEESWSELLEKLSWSIRYRLVGDDAKDIRDNVLKLFNELLPKSPKEEILFYVKNVPWNFQGPYEAEDADLQQNKRRAEALGKRLSDDLDTLRSVVDELSRGETRETFAFGKSVYENTSNPNEAIEIAFNGLTAAEAHNPNPSLFAGMLYALGEQDSNRFIAFLKRVFEHYSIRQFTTYLASLHLSPDAISIVVDGLNEGTLLPQSTHVLGMGQVLKPLPTDCLTELFTSLRKLGSDGVYAALDLLGMRLHDDSIAFSELRAEVDATLRTNAIFDDKIERSMIAHHYETLARKLIKDAEYGPSFSDFIAASLVRSAKKGAFGNDRLFQQLAKLIFEHYPRESLEVFARHVEEAPTRDRWLLTHILGTPFSFHGKGEGALFKLDESVLLAACKKYPKRFAPLVAEIAPLFDNNDGLTWSHIGSALLDQFGARKDILSALSSNIHTGGWSGPISDHLRRFIPPLEQAKTHKLPSVRRWASMQLEGLNQQIASEKRDEEEYSLRNN